jgi:hypothetical protein
MSTLEMWAAYCVGMKATFEAYTSGCDLLAANAPYWEDKGMPMLLRAVEMAYSAAP